MENDKIYGWSLILSEFPLHESQPLTGSVQKTFVGPVISVWFGIINTKVELSYAPAESHG